MSDQIKSDRTLGEWLDALKDMDANWMVKLRAYRAMWTKRQGGSMMLLISFGPDQAAEISVSFCDLAATVNRANVEAERKRKIAG